METLIILDLLLKITAKNQHSDAGSSSFQRVRTVPCEQYQEMGELEETVNCLDLSRVAWIWPIWHNERFGDVIAEPHTGKELVVLVKHT